MTGQPTLDAFVTHLLHDAGAVPRTADRYRRYAEQFCATADPFRATEATSADWVRAISVVDGRPASPSTVNVKVCALRAFFRFLEHTGRRRGNPFAAVPLRAIPPRLPSAIRREELRALFGLLDPDAEDPMTRQDAVSSRSSTGPGCAARSARS